LCEGGNELIQAEKQVDAERAKVRAAASSFKPPGCVGD
jgi:hypothetical protein